MDSMSLKVCAFNCSERSNPVGAYDGGSYGLTEDVALESIGHLLVHPWNTGANNQEWTGGVMHALLLHAELLAIEGSGRVGSHYLWMCTLQAPVGSSMLMVTQKTPS